MTTLAVDRALADNAASRGGGLKSVSSSGALEGNDEEAAQRLIGKVTSGRVWLRTSLILGAEFCERLAFYAINANLILFLTNQLVRAAARARGRFLFRPCAVDLAFHLYRPSAPSSPFPCRIATNSIINNYLILNFIILSLVWRGGRYRRAVGFPSPNGRLPFPPLALLDRYSRRM